MRLNEWHAAFGALLAGDAHALQREMRGTAHFSVQQRLAVYTNNYHQGLISNLRLTFERCNALVGDDYFTQLAADYVQHNPPNLPLNDYGAGFPVHLERLQQEKQELQAMGYLPDLARLDWLCDQVHGCAERNVWPGEAFAALTPDQQAAACLQLSADCFLMRSHWSLSTLWALHLGLQDSADMQYRAQAEYLLITRQDYRVTLEVLPQHIYLLLEAVQQNRTVQALVAQYPQGVAQLPMLLAKGWIDGFKVDAAHAGT